MDVNGVEFDIFIFDGIQTSLR